MKQTFSQRIGLEETPPVIQVNGMDDGLRNSIWNLLYTIFSEGGQWRRFALGIAQGFRKSRLDEISEYEDRCCAWVKEYFFSLPWNKVYELLEYTAGNISRLHREDISTRQMEKWVNGVLEQELSGYRFVSGTLIPISNSAEMSEIGDAIQLTKKTGLDGAHKHLQTAVTLLAQKPDPDYRNSIKESILVIESIAKVISKENSQGLKGALTELGKKIELHASLREGFNKLYGYTSDEGGIRHAFTIDDQDVGLDEAKYMLVSCSAFANYLISKAQSASLL